MTNPVTIVNYSPDQRDAIRRILSRIGWAEQYIAAMESAVEVYSSDPETYRVYLAVSDGEAAGYLYVQYYAWNRLCQIQGLAVRPEFQRQGIASALVRQAEDFARSKKARGLYADTPADNTGGRKFYEAAGYRFGYLMPRYYEAQLDGVTYQKFFNGNQTDEGDQTHSN